jgi:hypothetical protein
VLRLEASAPFRAEIGELGLDAFDFKLDRGIAREGERHMTSGRIVRLEVNREKRQNPVALPLLEIPELSAKHPVESERRPPPPVFVGSPFASFLPIEPVEHCGKTLLRGQIGEVANAHHRILEMR